MRSDFKVLGVCGAQGALLLPFKKHLVANIEPRGVFHTKNEEQWKLNFEDIPFFKSLEEFLEKGEDISRIIGPDIIIGSPSCGHSSVFSYSRKKSLGKPKEDPTLNLFISSVNYFQPEIFLLENLPKLLEFIPVTEWEHNLENYNIITHCHSVNAFGNTQKSRKRLVLIGIHKRSKLKVGNFTKLFKINDPNRTTTQLKKEVIKEHNYREEPTKKLAMYHYKDTSKTSLTVEQVRQLWRGEFRDEFKWPMKTHRMKTLPGVYRNRKNAPPLTVRPSNRQFSAHGRVLGLDELRVIMGFPRSFKVYFDSKNPTYWLNKGRNTITKGSVFEVGLWFKKCLKNGLKQS